jgi:hypothetical protein
MVGQAFSMNGSNAFVQIPDSPVLRPTNLTVEAWVLFTSLDSPASGSSPAGQQFIVFKQNSRRKSFNGYFLGKTRRTGGDFFAFAVTSANGVSAEVDSTNPIVTGTWYHVAGVRGTNFIQIYVNGQLIGQTSVSFPQDYGTFPLYFGTSGQSSFDHKFAGQLDEVSLYNRPLSASEIAAIYTAGAAGKCKGPTSLAVVQSPNFNSSLSGYSGSAFPLAVAGPGSSSNFGTTQTPGPSALPQRPLVNIRLSAAGECQLTVKGRPAQFYRLEASDDLIHWIPLVTASADSSGLVYFTDTSIPNSHPLGTDSLGPEQTSLVRRAPRNARFYRAVALSPQ